VIVLFVLLLVLNFQTLIGTIGTGAIFTTILFVAISFAIGYFLAPYPEARSVLGLGTAQRNIAAALVVATGNFGDDPAVLTMIVIGSLLMMVILFPAAGELGRRNRRSELS
jgi:BASS family bile acid:Na+ symporter